MLTRDEISVNVDRDMKRHLKGADWNLQQKLAISCRILAAEGHTPGLAGQISARGEKPGTCWTLRFGDGFDEVSASRLMLVDEELNVLEGSEGMANPATRFHVWVYKHRPDVNCIIHTHPVHVSALSMLDEELVVAHMDTTPFHDDCAYLPEWPGLPIANEEGQIISDALGGKRAIVLAHHGQLVACKTVEEATYMAFWIEHAAKLHMLARSVGKPRAIQPELAKEAHDFLLTPSVVNATFAYWARKSIAREPGSLL